MRSVLFTLSSPSWATSLWIVFGAALVIGGWLWWLQRRHACTREHVSTGLTLLAISVCGSFVLRRIGHLDIHAWGAMLMTGVVLGAITAIRLGRRRGVSADTILNLSMLIMLGAIIGARVLYWAITPNAGPLLDIHGIIQGGGLAGLSFHGGLLGGTLAATIYILVTRGSFWRITDCLAPAVAIGYAITRIGCFLNGCCYGKPAPGVPWAVTFPHTPDGCIVGVHPTQLYGLAMGITMYGILLWLARGNSQGRAGRLLMAFFMLEGVERFVLEFFRQPDPHFHGILTPAQYASLAFILLGAIGWFLLPKRPAVLAPVAESPDPTESAGLMERKELSHE